MEITPLGPVLEVGTRPHYDRSTCNLYYVDVTESKVYKYSECTGEIVQATVGDEPIGFMFPVDNSDTTFIASLGLNLVFIEWDGASQQVKIAKILRVDGTGRFNGGKVDPYGRLWAGTMGATDDDGNVIPGKGTLYSFSKGVLQKREDDVGISNGLAWDTSRNKMYYVDTMVTKVLEYDHNPTTGAISNRKEVFDFESNNIKGAPDGLTIDADNYLWVAAIFGSCIIQFNPVDGAIIRNIEIPTPQVTAITFFGNDLMTIFVTSARMADKEGVQPNEPAGRSFTIKNLGVKGVNDVRYIC